MRFSRLDSKSIFWGKMYNLFKKKYKSKYAFSSSLDWVILEIFSYLRKLVRRSWVSFLGGKCIILFRNIYKKFMSVILFLLITFIDVTFCYRNPHYFSEVGRSFSFHIEAEISGYDSTRSPRSRF